MTQQVADRRHTRQRAPRAGGAGRALNRPAGRRLLLLVALACASVLAIAASSAQAAGLPDGRAYEQVTPANKDNGDPYIRAGVFGGYQAASTGDAFSYPSLYGFPGSQFNGIPYLATRGSGGWTNTDLVPPQSTEAGALCSAFVSTVAFSSDMSSNILADGANSASGCGTDDPPLVPGTTSGGLPLCSATPLVTPCSGEQPGVQNLFVRNSKTGASVLVSSLESAPPATTPADANYDGSTADLSHVVFDESATLTGDAPGAGADDLYEWSGGNVALVTMVPSSGTSCSGASCTAVAGSLAGGSAGNALHAISDDGSTVFFTANGNLYARQNGSSTVQVDAGVGGGGAFAGASADGSKVFFTDSTGALDEYDFSASSPLTDLTPGGSAQVQGVSGLSDDGSHVYFVADSVLASNANGEGQTAQSGQPNLYLVDTATSGDPITFIATLNPSDGCDWQAGCLSARVSSDGKWVAFTSVNSLTGYNNNGESEIFLSDSSADGPSCASCIPDGTPATSGASIPAPEFTGIESSVDYFQHSLTDNGQVFFQTDDALLPADANGAQDVYEYESGQVHLLSTGTSPVDSFFLDATTNGSDVFLLTSQPLVPQDIDGAYDIYDARVGGGFPVTTPTPPCQGESCKPPESSPAPVPVPGSSTFTGPKNSKSGHAALKVAHVRRTVHSARFALRLTVTAAGRLVVSGADITRVSRSVKRAGTYKLMLHLTGKARSRLKHKRKLSLSILATYQPSAASASAVKFNLTAKA